MNFSLTASEMVISAECRYRNQRLFYQMWMFYFILLVTQKNTFNLEFVQTMSCPLTHPGKSGIVFFVNVLAPTRKNIEFLCVEMP